MNSDAGASQSPSGRSQENASAGVLTPDVVLRTLLGDLRLLVTLPLLIFVIALLVLMIRPAHYRSESRMHPRAGQLGTSRLAGLAAQLGVVVPGVDAGADPVKLYVEMLGSQQLMRDALETVFTMPTHPEATDSVRGTLLDILGVPGAPGQDRIQNGVNQLRSMIDVTPNEGAGTIRLRVTALLPALAERLNRRVLELLNQTTVDSRRAQAGGERQFTETRLASAQDELTQAEGAVQRFLELNRSYENSPQLRGELDRLRRRVDLRQQVFVALAQGYEQARIDEQRNTPTFTVLDPPELTAVRVGRKRDALVWLPIGFALAVAISLGREAIRQGRSRDPAAWTALRTAWLRGIRRLSFRR